MAGSPGNSPPIICTNRRKERKSRGLISDGLARAKWFRADYAIDFTFDGDGAVAVNDFIKFRANFGMSI